MYHSCLFINFFRQKSVNLVAYSLLFVCVFEGPYNTVTWLSTFSLTLFLVLITHCTILPHLNYPYPVLGEGLAEGKNLVQAVWIG